MPDKSMLNPSGETPDQGIAIKKKLVSDLADQSAAMSSTPAKRNMPTPTAPQTVDKINPKGKFGMKPGEKRIDVSDMIKPLGSFKHGTDYVPRTGTYKLHEGEAVKTKKENMADWTKGISGGSEKKPKKEIKEIRIKKSHDGKHVIIHQHHHPEHHEDETHVASDMSELHKHMDDHAGTPNEGEAPSGGSDAMAQLTASPSPMPAPAAGPAAGAPQPGA